MTLVPEPGLVICYDFLWKEDRARGVESGAKDRPSAIILVVKSDTDSSSKVVVCPVTHTPPRRSRDGIEMPRKVATHLGLDEEQMWIKTDVVNVMTWEDGQVPFGVTPAKRSGWEFGILPDKLSKKIIESVLTNMRSGDLDQISR
jgi:hypothetical protein